MADDLRAFCSQPAMRRQVADALTKAWDDDEYFVMPDVDDVVADALQLARAEIRERAEMMSSCLKVDDCTAQSVVLYALAEWLEPTP